MSEIAFQMRKEITEKVTAGQSDREILDYYKQLYGERVLMEPEGAKRIVLYSIPILIALAGLAFVLIFLNHCLTRTFHTELTGTANVAFNKRIVETIRNATDEP